MYTVYGIKVTPSGAIMTLMWYQSDTSGVNMSTCVCYRYAIRYDVVRKLDLWTVEKKSSFQK